MTHYHIRKHGQLVRSLNVNETITDVKVLFSTNTVQGV